MTRLLLIFFISNLLLSSCDKGTLEDPVALFSLIEGDSCSPILASGVFRQGQIPSAEQNLQLPIHISKIGKWSISTDTVNGFSFTARGEFTDTGRQIISLNASGIPSLPGNYSFSVTLGSIKQTIGVSILKDGVTPEFVPENSYVSATLNGTKYYAKSAYWGPDDVPYTSGGNGDTASVGSHVGQGSLTVPTGPITVSLQKDFLYNFLSITEPDFKKFFTPGSYPFSVKICPSRVSEGVILFLGDSTRQPWTSLAPPGAQPNSYFTITGIEDGHDQNGMYFVKVRSRFKCRLYALLSTATMELTDGEMVSYFKLRPR
jgi:hypothetical protein